jgi:hypothetical protein
MGPILNGFGTMGILNAACLEGFCFWKKKIVGKRLNALYGLRVLK